jgi:acyl-CoA thioesterase
VTQEENNNEELALDYYKKEEDAKTLIQTHERINQDLSGEVIKMQAGYVEVRLTTTAEMIADDIGLIHSGFIFSAADYAAMLAVNERNVILVGSDCQFLSPVKFHDEVNIIAKVRHKEGRKRNVYVEGFVFDIKVFEGEFKTVITEKHVLKLHLLDGEEDEEN